MWMANNWGTTARERKLAVPCDDMIQDYDPACTLYRGVTINAPASTVFQWLSHLRVAPYSYDWMTTSAVEDRAGYCPTCPRWNRSNYLGIFELIDFEVDKSLSIRATPAGLRKFQLKDLVVSHMPCPQDDQAGRLLVKGLMKYRINGLCAA